MEYIVQGFSGCKWYCGGGDDGGGGCCCCWCCACCPPINCAPAADTNGAACVKFFIYLPRFIDSCMRSFSCRTVVYQIAIITIQFKRFDRRFKSNGTSKTTSTKTATHIMKNSEMKRKKSRRRKDTEKKEKKKTTEEWERKCKNKLF